MKFKILFLFFFVLFSVLSNVFAQNTEAGALTDETDKLYSLRRQTMDDEIWALMSRRDSSMDEEIEKISRKKETGEFLFNLSSMKRNAFPPDARKENFGAGNFFSVRNTRNALGFSFESENEERKILSAPLPSHRKRLLFEETLETKFQGSVYHPNFVDVDADLEVGLAQNREKFQPNLAGKLKNSSLNRYHVLSSFLNKKPYVFSLSAEKSRQVQNREFFERQIINSNKYGGNFGFRNKALPASFSFSKSEKVIDRLSRPSQDFQDDELSLNLNNQSELLGETFFDANQDKFSRTESGTPDQNGVSRDFNLTNRKYLSEDERKMLYSSLRSYGLTGTSKSRVLNLNENFDIKHTDSLDSSYNYSFSDKSSSGVNAKDNRISAALRHQLYESLNSSFNTYYFNSKATSFSQDTYGVSLDEAYVKKLGKIGKFTSGAGIAYSEDKRETMDNVISIIDEAHTLTTGVLTFLDMPRADTATVVVTNAAGDITYVLNVDYLLTEAAERTQIQRVPGGSILDGQDVVVDYRAQSSPLVKFNTLSQNYRFRMDFLEQLIGVYYNLSKESHPRASGGENLVLQKLTDTIVGVDFNYKNFSVELSGEDYDSNLSPYKQTRIKESYFFNPTEKSTLTFDSSQCKVRFISSQDTQKFFDFISRYTIGLNAYSRLNAEAGFRWQEGTGIDLDDITAGSGYELSLNKFTLDIKYEFRKQQYLTDTLINHFISFKAKRVF